MDRIRLMALSRDLYDPDALNRRALHARVTPNSATDLGEAVETTDGGWVRRIETFCTGAHRHGPKRTEVVIKRT
jgi:hypothetical protein